MLAIDNIMTGIGLHCKTNKYSNISLQCIISEQEIKKREIKGTSCVNHFREMSKDKCDRERGIEDKGTVMVTEENGGWGDRRLRQDLDKTETNRLTETM